MSDTMIKAKINGIDVEVPQGTTILDAAKSVYIHIPTLCKHPDLDPSAACGICIVKVAGSNKMLRACCTDIAEGMDIITHDAEIVEVRRTVVELILSNHPTDCLSCGRNNNCELQTLAADFGIRDVAFDNICKEQPKDDSTGTIVLDPSKCIGCGRCVEVCQNIQDVWALSFLNRGIDTRMAPAGDIVLSESPCVRCGQCSAHCPTGAIFEYDQTKQVWDALRDPDTHCVVQIAPAVRVAVGEAFGFEPGTNMTGQLYAALRRMGFDQVFDTNFSADVTIMEEGSEFIERFVNKKGPLPLITTCCPAWVDMMEKNHTDVMENFSSAKSPQAMMGALIKTYYADKAGVDAKKICSISIMPCTAKKYEVKRSEDMYASGEKDVDITLTTREIARMIKQAGICFDCLPAEEADHLLGDYTGAGTIFGVTGGVMEAALRTAYCLVTEEKPPKIDFESVRGLEGVKEAAIDIKGTEVRIAVAHGLSNVEYVLDKVRKARDNGEELPYHFIEVMACPGGCIGGGGQPYGVSDEVRKKRTEGLYQDDRDAKQRYSHENPMVIKLYEDFLEKPLSHKAHELLHTKYQERDSYKK